MPFDHALPIDLEEALGEGWLELWYQPKIELKRKCLAGAEVLLRLRHPQHGILLPERFVPALAEDSITRLTEQTLTAALASWTTFNEAGFNLKLAIDVPLPALLAVPWARMIDDHRPRDQRWPGIILEVREDEITRELKLARDIAVQLSGSEIKLAIDDFGAGFSSLSSLRQLPFVELKLHASFVKDCATDATSAAICQTAVDLAHRLGSAAVAQGIDNAADLQALSVMGCDAGQGVLIAPPMPHHRLLEMLLERRAKSPLSPAVPVGG